VKPLRAIIDAGDFGAARLSQSAKAPALHPGCSTAVKTTALWGRHLGERFEGLGLRENGSFASGNVGLAVGFRIVRQRRKRGVQDHAFRPFLIRMNSDVDLLIERNASVWSDRDREAPIRGKQRREQKAPYPPEILKHRHDRSLSARERIAVRSGRPR